MKIRSVIASLALACFCAAVSAHESGIDERSYKLGIMGAFSEVVRLGVKTLALSEVMTPEEMDDVMADAVIGTAPRGSGISKIAAVEAARRFRDISRAGQVCEA